ncbi:MAG TPA: DnaJ domain-containing protein [Thermoanaerobaculia bacterium]|nr:DnaJ domain-containing protein [Thermoanaerobaculia bacterium]
MTEPRRSQAPSDDEVAQFSRRIERSLVDHPFDGDAEMHRSEIARLIGTVGAATWYELLDIPPTASEDEIHDSYERLARAVHPTHASALGLAGREGVLELLFERATAAYLTLHHPDRRRRYDREVDVGGSAQPTGAVRLEETRCLARQIYERAAGLAGAKDYHFAVELLRQAVRTDPQPEYFAALGRALAQNPNWLRSAEENLRRAVELGYRDVETVGALKQVRERLEAEGTGPVRLHRTGHADDEEEEGVIS